MGMEADMPMPMGGGKVDQGIVVYMSGEYGPFACKNCKHFMAPYSCDVVAGEIDPEGISHLFEPLNQDPLEAPVPTEGEEAIDPEALLAAAPPPDMPEEAPLG
jgi:hypothetical protein